MGAESFAEALAAQRAKAAARRKRLWQEAHRAARLLKQLGADRVLVFGSLASGRVHPDSDLDLLVVWDTPLGEWDRLRVARRALGNVGVAVDLVVVSPIALKTPTSFLQEILREGIELP
jgi:predicted nucleotidyltransferase